MYNTNLDATVVKSVWSPEEQCYIVTLSNGEVLHIGSNPPIGFKMKNGA